VEDVKNLTRDEAIQIYKQEFWNKMHIGEIQDQRIAEAYFFAVVNMGPHFSSLYLQESLNEIGVPVALDGIVGIKTRAKLNSLSKDKTNMVLAKLLNKLRARYESLATLDPEYAEALSGWLARLAIV
jgi:lysozyme family protein